MIQLKKSVTPIRTVDLDQYVSGDQTVWPAGQATLNVSFTDTGGRLPAYGVFRADYDSSVLTAARITRVSYRNYERVSQSGSGLAAADFAVFSGTPSNTLFPMPRSPYTLLVTLAVNVAPLANEDVVFHLRPPEQLPEAMAQAAKRRAGPVAKQFVRNRLPLVVKRAAAKRRPGVLSKLRSAGSAIWRRLPFVAGVGSLSDASVGQLVGALGNADVELENIGAAALDEFVMGLGEELGQELEESPEMDELVGDLLDVLGNVWAMPEEEY